MQQQGQVIWITGLSGAGKSTIAQMLTQQLQADGHQPILLDGDELRAIFASTNQADYNRNQRLALAMQYCKLCQTLASQGFIVVIATISMFKEIYQLNREILPNYCEVYLNIPLGELQRRDPKGLYQQYANGNVRNMAGLDLPIDEPTNPHILIEHDNNLSPSDICALILTKILKDIS